MPDTASRASAMDVSVFVQAVIMGLWSHLVEQGSATGRDEQDAWNGIDIAGDTIAALDRLEARFPEESGYIDTARGLVRAALLCLESIVAAPGGPLGESGTTVDEAWDAAAWTVNVVRHGFDAKGGDDGEH